MPVISDKSHVGCQDVACGSKCGPSTKPTYQPVTFWEACQVGNIRLARSMLEGDPELSNAKSEQDKVPALHWAALNGRWHIAKLLLQKGAMVNTIAGANAQTALHWAASKGHPAVASLLLSEGADPLIQDGQGQTALHIAAQQGQPWVALLLLASGVAVDQPDSQGRTPLFWAAYHGRTDCVQILLQEGAQVNFIDKKGLSILHYAVAKGHQEVVKQLLEARADPEALNAEGRRPADLAAQKGFSWYEGFLVELGMKSTFMSIPVGIKKSIATKWMPFVGFPLMMLLPSWLTWLSGGKWWLALIGCAVTFQLMRWLWGRALPGMRSSDTSTIHWIHQGLNVTGVFITVFIVAPASLKRWPLHALNLFGSVQIVSRLFMLGRQDPGRVQPLKTAEERRKVKERSLVYLVGD